MKAISSEFVLIKKLFDFNRIYNIPVSYSIGGTLFHGIDPSLICEMEESTEGTKRIYTLCAKTAEDLKLTLRYTEYTDFPVIEWVFYITNVGQSNSPIISDLLACDYTVIGSSPRLLHGNGDNFTLEGYSWWNDELTADPIIKHPLMFDGNSCMGAFPYMRLIFDEYLVNLAIGWSAAWQSSIRANESGAEVKIGQKTFRSYLKPGETVRTPSMTVMVSENEDRIRNLWRSWYYRHLLQKQHGEALKPKLSLSTSRIYDLPEFCGANEENQFEAIDTFIEKGMKPDIWWIDAGWFEMLEANVWKSGVGNFYCDSSRFPNGLAPIGKKCKENNIDFLLWMESERVHAGTKTDREHPEYLLYFKDSPHQWYRDNALFNLANTEACDWLIDTIDGLIKDYGLTVYRQDFNYQPMQYWDRNAEPDREGILENLHIQGLYRLWDTLKERNPHLWIDNCAMGGRRNDIELMRRSVPLHYSDMAYGIHAAKQGQYRQMFEWIPYFRSSALAWDQPDGTYDGNKPRMTDDFAYLTIMTAPAATPIVKYTDDDSIFELARKFSPIWRRSAEISVSGDYYPLTVCRRSDEDWYASQFDDAEHDRGCIHVIRNIACEKDEIILMPHVDDSNLERTYKFTDTYKNETFSLKGSELKNGLKYSCPKRSGTLFIYEID